MAETHKKPDSDPAPKEPAHKEHAHPKGEAKRPAKVAAEKKGPAAASSPAGAKPVKGAPAASVKKAAPKPGAKPAATAKKPSDVKIVEKKTPKYVANPKPTLTAEQKHGLALRRSISDRRPWFRRQQWYEYKRLADSGWRKPTGVDSAQRRHFGYEQPVVRIGFGGPRSVRGLHPSGFREVYVEHVDDLKTIDKKTQAARISGHLGARKLKVIYAEADKLGVHVLNRRNLQ